jgi:adenylate kinase
VHKYVILGIQGSGKGTQARLLADDFDLEHVSVGEIFRWNVQHHTKIGAQVRRTIAAGSLVPDDLVESVVGERLAAHDWNYGFIIDGFPRNARQAEFFLESYDIDGVINLHLDDTEVHRRVLARRLCTQCGADFNLLARPPKEEGTCDLCQGRLATRTDDNPAALAVRLAAYHGETRPVIEIFQRKEYVITIDGAQDITTIQQAIRTRLPGIS